MTLADNAIAWYEANARDLPWRQPDTTPWGVMVSEVMLQQTPVVRVEPAWRSWMTRWPTPSALAADPPSEAIRMWGRLGYPRRAMRLHACAVAMVAKHNGDVPSDLDELLALPGIGTYTARAVATFAFGQRHPVVDTNVRRVVARVVEGQPDAGPATTAADLVAMTDLLPSDPPRAARASIAFMELGALVCVARNPKCLVCPLENVCLWRASGQKLPDGPSRKPQTYAGTDRQVRGLILEVLRHATGPVPRPRIDVVWGDDVQRARALAALVSDGLVEPRSGDSFALAGDLAGDTERPGG
ncbi:A/G-specific adenine glycosylase [Actinoplanes sp. NPDC049265]|uniref:A/G-specific adenine glycosylase n=1 Tax=Actinoplanes sp. NPDC049265 TaxID=3363902 RepID=UPI003717AC63